MISKRVFLLAALLAFCFGAQVTEVAAAPKPISSCQTISASGSYILTKNLAAVGHCLILTADSITINLDGYTIMGDGTGSGIRHEGEVSRNITIRNGVITNFVVGIEMGSNSMHIIVEHMRVTQNSFEGILVSRAIIRDNIVNGNLYGIVAFNASLITGNVANGNGFTGIQAGQGCVVSDNTANDNGGNGIAVPLGVGASTVSNNTARGNRFGFYVYCPSNLIGNTATDNTDIDIYFNLTGCGSSHNVPNVAAP